MESVDPNKNQVGGEHYKSMAVQPWDAMAAWLTPEEFRGYLRGNIVKYAARIGRKDSDDVGKLIHYAQKLQSLNSVPVEKECPGTPPTATAAGAVKISVLDEMQKTFPGWSRPDNWQDCRCPSCGTYRTLLVEAGQA